MSITSHTRRTRVIGGGLSLLVGLGGGLLVGRAVGGDDTAAARVPQAVDAPPGALPDGSPAPAPGEPGFPT